MTFYVVTVNGEVGTVAHLSEAEGETLRQWAKAQSDAGIVRVHVTELNMVSTELERVKMQVEADIDSWLP